MEIRQSDAYCTMALTLSVTVTLLLFLPVGKVKCQNPIFDQDVISGQNNLFFFDKNSDCNDGTVRELYDSQAVIYGSDSSTTQLGPTSCTIMLMSTSQFEGTLLDIQVESMNIQDCDTTVSIYDGEGAQVPLMTYDCRSSSNQNRRRFTTTGAVATFVMTRKNVESILYDVEIRVNPIRGGVVPGIDDNLIIGYPYAFDKFSQDAIVGMVGGFYGLVLLVCIAFIVYWYRTYQGLNKEWETHQLAALKTGSVFGPPSHAPTSRAWSVDLGHSRPGPASQYSRKYGPPSEDGDSAVVYNDERFEMRKLVHENKGGARSRQATTNGSYSDREDGPDHFVEKVITSRARPINRGRDAHRSQRPPSYDEAVSDRASERSSDEDSGSSGSVGKKSFSSEERSSRRSRSTRSESSTQSESESDERSSHASRSSASTASTRRRIQRRRNKDKPQGARARKPPTSRSNKKRRNRDSSNASEAESARSHPRNHHPPAHAQPAPYGAPGQFVPVMAAPPYQMVPGYAPPPLPMQVGERPAPQYQVQPTDPPVYSYLVRRGYTPVDQCSARSGESADTMPEEPDMRLSSGVDYMRR